VNRLLLGRKRCGAEITVTTRSLLGRPTRAETVTCLKEDGHDRDRFPTEHRGVATQLKRSSIPVTWRVNREGHAVLTSPDNLIEVN